MSDYQLDHYKEKTMNAQQNYKYSQELARLLENCPLTNAEDVRAFREKIGLPISEKPKMFKDAEEAHFWLNFLREEIDELDKSLWDEDKLSDHKLNQTFDALLDLVYVAMGAALVLGLPWQEGWDRVHTANMLKEAGTKLGRSGHPDAIKPKGWQSPDLSDLVNGGKDLT